MNYEKIREKIKNGDYEKEATETEWAGAGIALCAEPRDVWETDDSIDYYCTKNACCFVWLLKLLAEPLYEKYPMDKYGNLAAFVRAIRQAKKESSDLKEQLLFVTNAVGKRENGEEEDPSAGDDRWDAPKDTIRLTGKKVPELQKLIDELNTKAKK